MRFMHIPRPTANQSTPQANQEVISKVRDGRPNPAHISISFVDRQNLAMRMRMRRFTRLTNAVQQEIREPESRSRATLRSLQLLQGTFEFENNSRDGSGDFGRRVGSGRTTTHII